MKAKYLKAYGFELMIEKSGTAVWVLPAAAVSETAGREMSEAQLATLVKANLESAGRKLVKLTKPAEPVAATAPDGN